MIYLRKVAGQLGAMCGVILAAASAGHAVPPPPPPFSTGIVVPLNGSPTSAQPILVVADVGSMAGPLDGCPDVVTAGQELPITIAFGNCHGSFAGAVADQGLSGVPTATVFARFDATKQASDLVVADQNGEVQLFRGNPTSASSFAPPADISGAGPGIAALAAGDVNNDGKTDLVVLNSPPGGSSLTVLFGDGAGNFSPGPVTSLGTGTFSVLALARFGNDQVVDATVISSAGSTMTILHGDGSGNFTPAPPISQGLDDPAGVAAGDVNGDGITDLVVANRGSDSVAVFIGNAAGTFAAAQTFSSGTATSLPNSVVLFDANGDGKLDVAVSNNFSSDVSVLLGDGKGNLGVPRSFVTDQEPLVVAAADVNGDTIPDLIALNKNPQGHLPAGNVLDAVVLVGQGDGTFRGVENIASASSPGAVVAADTDNHGVPDLIVGHSNGVVEVHLAVPGDGFQPPTNLQSHGDAVAVAAGDFSGDGRIDIAAVNRQTGDVSIFVGQRNGFSPTPQNYPVGPGASAVVVGDWNGDGRDDLAITREIPSSPGVVSILLAGPNGSFGAPVTMNVGTDPVAIATGDFNKDGRPDLVVGNAGDGTISMLIGNPDGTFQSAITLPNSVPNIQALAVGDFDNEGHDDIAVSQGVPTGLVQVLYGSAQGTFTPSQVPQRIQASLPAIVARDFDGDQVPDLAVLNFVDDLALAFICSGKSLLPAGNFPVARYPAKAAAGDFDGDGRFDLASSDSFTAGTVSVLTNIVAGSVLRGDSNSDGKVTAADLVRLTRKLGESAALRVEQVGRSTAPNFQAAAGPGADANGDGLVNRQDLFALGHRLFPKL